MERATGVRAPRATPARGGGDLGTADEHAAGAAVENLGVRLGATAERPVGPAVAVASPEHDGTRSEVVWSRAIAWIADHEKEADGADSRS